MAFVHGERGISQRVISYWWAFGRLRAIASLKDGLSSDGYRQQLSELPHRHTAAVSKPKGRQSKRIRHTARPIVFVTYTDQASNSSKAAYSQVQIVPSHNAQQAEVNTQATLSPPPTTANYPNRAKFERNATCNAMNTYNRYDCMP